MIVYGTLAPLVCELGCRRTVPEALKISEQVHRGSGCRSFVSLILIANYLLSSLGTTRGEC